MQLLYNITKNKNILLLCMLISYIIPIIFIFLNYSCNNSVSNIICKQEFKNIILTSMIIMGFFTILYELRRKDKLSLVLVSLLLLGIFGVICTNESINIHYLFAGIVFLSIIGFMINQCCMNNKKNKSNKVLNFLLFIQSILLIVTIINIKTNIFFLEVFFILNFAIFYLYLHFNSLKKK